MVEGGGQIIKMDQTRVAKKIFENRPENREKTEANISCGIVGVYSELRA
jgi:hypothetical protein